MCVYIHTYEHIHIFTKDLYVLVDGSVLWRFTGMIYIGLQPQQFGGPLLCSTFHPLQAQRVQTELRPKTHKETRSLSIPPLQCSRAAVSGLWTVLEGFYLESCGKRLELASSGLPMAPIRACPYPDALGASLGRLLPYARRLEQQRDARAKLEST